ncbi:MAG: hypothetical protein AB7O66_14940 [Limisphaerales bacterium]
MKSLLAATLFLAGTTCPLPLSAADSSANDQAIEAKEAEVRRLRDALRAQERELELLRRENQALREEQNRSASPPPTPPPAGAQSREPESVAIPDRPRRTLGPLVAPSPGDVVDAGDLMARFAEDPDAATANYSDRTFLVRGEILRLETALLQRRFWVEFRTNEPTPRLRALIVFPASWPAVFASGDASRLVERGDRSNRTVLQSGDTVTIRARCRGSRGSEIRFDRGELLPQSVP